MKLLRITFLPNKSWGKVLLLWAKGVHIQILPRYINLPAATSPSKLSYGHCTSKKRIKTDRNLLESTRVKIGGAAMFIFTRENLLSSVFPLLIEGKAVWSDGSGSPEVMTLGWARSTPKPGL